jgi:nucleoside 2-deoxyribosyltransferase
MPALYYAAPLFTQAERSWNLVNATVLRSRFTTAPLYLPQEFCAHLDATPGAVDFAGIYAACLSYLERCDIVLAILDGADADSGTSFEVGYARARGLPIIGLRTDWRPAEDGGGNCMLTRSCRTVCPSLDAAMIALEPLLREPTQHLA